MIGDDIRARVFRDTASLYLDYPSTIVAPSLVRFVRRHAGKRVLDLGCATGNYCLHLATRGYDVHGADVNPAYVRIAASRGVDAHLITDSVPFPDKSFDTVLLFEVIEHLADPLPVLAEARRLARSNVLITTPHSGDIDLLRVQGLLYEHIADLDHRNFFTEGSLTELLSSAFPRVRVRKGNGMNPFAMMPLAPIRTLGKVLGRLRVIPPAFHFRLYAVAEV